jgi:hypothetical protein
MQSRTVHVTIAWMWDRAARGASEREAFGEGCNRGMQLARGGWRVSIGLAALLVCGCSAIVDPELRKPAACNPGDTNACFCTDGTPGIQRCDASGSYDDCKNMAGNVCRRSETAGAGGGRQ